MFEIFITLLVITWGITDATDDCELHVSGVCSIDEPKGFPTTEDDLDEICTNMIDFFECGIKHEKKCRPDSNDLQTAYEIFDVVQDVCNKDTLMHTVIVENLKCFGEFLEEDHRECYPNNSTEEMVQQTYNSLIEAGHVNEEEENSDNTYLCVRGLYSIACIALKLEKKCGEQAMEASLDIFRKLAHLGVADCVEEIRELLPIVIRLSRVEEEIENSVEEVFKRKK